jgi:predicted kinase
MTDNKMLILIRGLSGSGKTLLADSLTLNSDYEEIEGRASISADDYFTDDDGNYSFNHEKLGEAHHWCVSEVQSMMDEGLNMIVVHNTFKQQWEAQKYFNLVEKNDYQVQVISLYDGGMTDAQLAERNVHGLNERQINNQRKKWDLNIHPHRQNRKSRSHSYQPHGYYPPPPHHHHHYQQPYGGGYQGKPRHRRQNDNKWSGSGRQY